MILAAVFLVAAIGAAVWQRVPASVVAMGGALILLLTGVLSWHDARSEAGDLAPTLVVLTALLVLGDGCERAGLFDALAARLAAGSKARGVRLLMLVFGAAAAVTAVLGLDATVVLLTPAVFGAAAKARLPGRPHVYACTHLANSSSLLLPISNLTNLLAVQATGIGFARFAGYMAAPWAVALAVEWVVFRRVFRTDLEARGRAVTEVPPLPRAPLVVLGVTLLGFVFVHQAAYPATAGALLMLALERRAWRGIDVGLVVFVLGLGLIVAALDLGGTVKHLLPTGDGVLALLGATAVAAVLANLFNNLPALLVLLPAAVAAGTPTVLAVLIGVNAGPNLTYTGSLATLLWRRVLPEEPGHAEFHKLGALTVPPVLILCTVALWLVT